MRGSYEEEREDSMNLLGKVLWHPNLHPGLSLWEMVRLIRRDSRLEKEALTSPNNLAFLLILVIAFDKCVCKEDFPRFFADCCTETQLPSQGNKLTGNTKSLEASKLLDKMLSDLERRREMDQKTLLKAPFPAGSSGFKPALSTQREEMPGSPTEDAADTSRRVPSSQKGTGSAVCQGTRCLLELIAIVAGGELVFMLCCVGIWCCCKRKRSTSGHQMMDGGYSSHSHSYSGSPSRKKGLGCPHNGSEKWTPKWPSTRKPPITL
ncbi:uncharacterized protein LOC134057636 [Cinclus cinclus]|uniref:uncharacterized protein LOC134057636 n=1 Tax=Cinclus cinclus TaxID=127875 RepID=UPI002E0D961E